MDLYKTISILVFQKYSVITSLAIHTIFLIFINFKHHLQT